MRKNGRTRGTNIALGRRFAGTKNVSDYLVNYRTQATFTRTSEAAYVDPRDGWSFVEGPGNDGTGSFLTENQPRIFSDGAILIEGSRTNELRNSDGSKYLQTLENGAVSDSSVAAPNGGLAFDLAMSASDDGLRVRTNSIGVGESGVMSVYVRMPEGTGSVRLGWLHNDGTSEASSDIAIDDTWQRIEYLASNSETSTGVTGEFRVLNGSDGAERTVVVWGVQQTGPVPFESSFIRTPLDAIGTRVAESLVIPAANVPQEMKTGAFEFDFWPEFSSAQQIDFAYLIAFSDTSTSYLLISPGGETSRLFYRNATALKSGAFFSFDAGDKITIRVIHGVRFDVLLNGSLVDTQEVVGDWSQRIANWSIGGGGSAFGVISRPRRIKDA